MGTRVLGCACSKQAWPGATASSSSPLLSFAFSPLGETFLCQGDTVVIWASGVKGTFLSLIPSSSCFPWVTSRGHRLPRCRLFSDPDFHVHTPASPPEGDRRQRPRAPPEPRVWQRPLTKPSVTGERPQSLGRHRLSRLPFR